MAGSIQTPIDSVPPLLLERPDPSVEAGLLNGAVAGLFMTHMNKPAELMPTEPPSEIAGCDRVTPEDIAAFWQTLDRDDAPAARAPHLLDNLAQERLWILVDIAKNGRGGARQRATAELRHRMAALPQLAVVDAAALNQLVDVLDEAAQRDDLPVLFRTLRLAARRARRNHSEGSGSR